MNIIGLDLSINSTGCFVNDNAIAFPADSICFTKKGNLTKWFKIFEDVIEYNPYNKSKSTELVNKHQSYKVLANTILTTLKQRINRQEKTLVIMEGYSYSSNVGPLIDLVTLGTLVRDLILEEGWELKIFAPKEVKYFAGENVYPKTFTNKKETKWKIQNFQGVTAGRFNKVDIMQSIFDGNYSNEYIDFIIQNKELLDGKVPKPIDDVNDAFILHELGKKYIVEKLD